MPVPISATETEWLLRLDRDVEQAAGSELGYREAVARRRRWLLARRRASDRLLRASEPWALAELELAAGHRPRAFERMVTAS